MDLVNNFICSKYFCPIIFLLIVPGPLRVGARLSKRVICARRSTGQIKRAHYLCAFGYRTLFGFIIKKKHIGIVIGRGARRQYVSSPLAATRRAASLVSAAFFRNPFERNERTARATHVAGKPIKAENRRRRCSDRERESKKIKGRVVEPVGSVRLLRYGRDSRVW